MSGDIPKYHWWHWVDKDTAYIEEVSNNACVQPVYSDIDVLGGEAYGDIPNIEELLLYLDAPTTTDDSGLYFYRRWLDVR